MNQLSNEQQKEFKDKITAAFRQLRKHGYFAKQSFWCCSSCAWSDIPEDKVEKVVFYNKQSADGLKTGEVYLQWSGNGDEICNIFNQCGLRVSWEGSEDKAIVIES